MARKSSYRNEGCPTAVCSAVRRAFIGWMSWSSTIGWKGGAAERGRDVWGEWQLGVEGRAAGGERVQRGGWGARKRIGGAWRGGVGTFKLPMHFFSGVCRTNSGVLPASKRKQNSRTTGELLSHFSAGETFIACCRAEAAERRPVSRCTSAAAASQEHAEKHVSSIKVRHQFQNFASFLRAPRKPRAKVQGSMHLLFFLWNVTKEWRSLATFGGKNNTLETLGSCCHTFALEKSSSHDPGQQQR